jgi:hypothetical protein
MKRFDRTRSSLLTETSSESIQQKTKAIANPQLNASLFKTGVLKTRQATPQLAVLLIDPDGRAGKLFSPAPFILLNNVSASALGNMNNFVV